MGNIYRLGWPPYRGYGDDKMSATKEDVVWQLNEVCSLLYEAHVSPHEKAISKPATNCEICMGWVKAKTVLYDAVDHPAITSGMELIAKHKKAGTIPEDALSPEEFAEAVKARKRPTQGSDINCWFCHGWELVDRIDTGETTLRSSLPVYRLQPAFGVSEGELIDCPICGGK